MKVKNIMFSGFAAAILMGAVAEANAAPVAVASKGYVDSIAGAVGDLDGAADGAANLVQAINLKQDELTAGDNITIAPDGTISATDTNTTYTAGEFVAISDDNVITTTYAEGSYIDIDEAGKISATISAGNYITIDDAGKISGAISAGENVSISETGVISATDTNTTYTAGEFVAISDDNVITTTYTAGDNITIDGTGKISAKDTTYTAGDNVTIENGVISAQDTTYTAGENIAIENGKISATLRGGNFIDIADDGTISATYTAGNNITIGDDGKISTKMPAACQNADVVCVLTSEGGKFAWAVLTAPFDGRTMAGEAAQTQVVPTPDTAPLVTPDL